MPKGRDDWTSLSVYTEVYKQIDSIRGDQSYDEFFLALCDQYNPAETDEDFRYEHPNDEGEREWKTISLQKPTYEKIIELKSETDTFNDLFSKMLRQYDSDVVKADS